MNNSNNNKNNKQNKRPLVYAVPWNTDNQNKKYSRQDKQYIINSWKSGVSAQKVAIKLRRGLWAIQVQYMNLEGRETGSKSAKERVLTRADYIRQQRKKQLNLMNHQKKHGNQSKYPTVQRTQSKPVFKHRNRKFAADPRNEVVEGGDDIKDHLKELMGL